MIPLCESAWRPPNLLLKGPLPHFGYNAGFLFLASVAVVALAILYFFMPETRDKEFLNPTQGAATP
jgi:hypothetical protein